ncbi:MAG: hypothetical protein HXY20_01850 [Acidobacteria bacterium]|nr:hypothetical protein [Acidobacteriota bacterium]
MRLELEIGLLPVIVIKPPLFAPLMATPGFSQLPPPGFMAARVTAAAERMALFAGTLKK